MVSQCSPRDIDEIAAVINDSARAYRGIIPADRYHEPYMPPSEVAGELADGVTFLGQWVDGCLLGVMGHQDRDEVRLIRHAYVRTLARGTGIGSRLIRRIIEQSRQPLLVGTWAAADWAIRFYQNHGFSRVPDARRDELLHRYWRIPERQIAVSVVLADNAFLTKTGL